MFAIVTRNSLRSRRYSASMIRAWWKIRRQLVETPGMLAYTTAIANLQEFFTLTLWQRELDMVRFMASGAHADMMWKFRQWDESFWSMRWNPEAEEIGQWDARSYAGAAGIDNPGAAYASSIPQYLLQYLPGLREQQMQPQTCRQLPLSAVIGRVATPSPAAVLRLRRALRPWRQSQQLTRWVFAVGAGDCLLLAVWPDVRPDAAAEMLQTLSAFQPHAWAMHFQATDFEIGHWNQLRLRELVPQPA